MKALGLLILGGAFGVLSRYGISKVFMNPFYLGALFSNLFACFLFGYFDQKLSPNLSLFFFTGLLGGMSTFSSFIRDLHHFFYLKQFGSFLLLLLSHLIFGFFIFLLGKKIA